MLGLPWRGEVQPQHAALGDNTLLRLFPWNVTSDPCERLDLRRLGWGAEDIADFVTRSVVATHGTPGAA